MKTVFRILPLLTAAATVPGATAAAPPAPARQKQPNPAAATNAVFSTTVRLKYVIPSQAVRMLMTIPEAKGPKNLPAAPAAPKLPTGITGLTPKDDALSLTLHGTRKGVHETTRMLRLLDVKPRQIQVTLRLIEIRLAGDGTRIEKLLQSPSVTTTNNTSATIGFNVSDSSGSSVAPTPNGSKVPAALNTAMSVASHINGDGTISLRVSLTLNLASGQSGAVTEVTTSARLNQNEWRAMRLVSLSTNERGIQELSPDDIETIPASAYPLYRLDVSAAEVFMP